MKQARQIDIDTDVFARIWALRRQGELTENAVLRRLLLSGSEDANSLLPSDGPKGFHDGRHGVSFPEGFEIFRVHRGKRRSAIATGGTWRLDDGRTFESLNQLSRGLGAMTENAWLNWMFLNGEGFRQPIAEKRAKQTNSGGAEVTWRDDVVAALENIGGRGTLQKIYESVRLVRRAEARSLPASTDDIVRRTLEENCADTESYKGLYDLFLMPEGKGAGVWALR